jgi:hypothetical protein
MNTAWKHLRTFMDNRTRRHSLLIVTAALSVGLMLWGVLRNWHDLQGYNWRLEWQSLLLTELAYLAALTLTILAWTLLMRVLKAKSTWRQDAKFFFYSWMARRLPTPAPYLASRVLLYEEIGVPKRLTSLGLLWENVLLIASGAVLALLLFPITPLMRNHLLQTPVILAAVASFVVVIFPSILGRITNRALTWLGKERLPFFVNQAAASMLVIVYVSVWSMGGLLLFLLIRSVYTIEWSSFPLVLQSWVLSGLVSYITFFAPLGLGVRELTLAYLLALIIPLPVAIVVTILARLWITINELLLSLIAFKVL